MKEQKTVGNWLLLAWRCVLVIGCVGAGVFGAWSAAGVWQAWPALQTACPACTGWSVAGSYAGVFLLCICGIWVALRPPKPAAAQVLGGAVFLFALGICSMMLDFYFTPHAYNYEESVLYNYWPYWWGNIGWLVGGLAVLWLGSLWDAAQRTGKEKAVSWGVFALLALGCVWRLYQVYWQGKGLAGDCIAASILWGVYWLYLGISAIWRGGKSPFWRKLTGWVLQWLLIGWLLKCFSAYSCPAVVAPEIGALMFLLLPVMLLCCAVLWLLYKHGE